MSFDDELRNRMKQAADDAGAGADPAAAAARVAAATTATPVATTTVLKVVGGLAALGIAAGAVLGATVLQPDAPADAAAIADVNVQAGSTFDCPGGAVVGSLQPGDRVYVVGRDDGGEWSAVRDPAATARVVWVRETSLVPDDDPSNVPVVDCDDGDGELVAADAPQTSVDDTVVESVVDTTPESLPESTTTEPATTVAPTTTLPRGQNPQPSPPPTQPPITTPAPPVTPAPAPTTTPPPPPTLPPDTQAPGFQGSSSASSIGAHPACPPDRATLTMSANDNVGVTQITATYGPQPSGSLTFQRPGGSPQNGTWTATFGPFGNLDPGFVGQAQIQVTARDAAGNATSRTISVIVYGENCGLG